MAAAPPTEDAEDWVKLAMKDDVAVVSVLLDIRHAEPPPPPSKSTRHGSPVLKLEWSVRQRRSKHVPRQNSSDVVDGKKKKAEPTRASPTTPLSWSGGTSVSGGAIDGSEESSKPPKPTDAARSKVCRLCHFGFSRLLLSLTHSVGSGLDSVSFLLFPFLMGESALGRCEIYMKGCTYSRSLSKPVRFYLFRNLVGTSNCFIFLSLLYPRIGVYAWGFLVAAVVNLVISATEPVLDSPVIWTCRCRLTIVNIFRTKIPSTFRINDLPFLIYFRFFILSLKEE